MTQLSDLGERKAIDKIFNILSPGQVAIGPGDDCTALEIGGDYLLITTDMISQKTHIHTQMTPFQIGWFLVAINLSDIAAKGGTPLGLVLSFGLPRTTTENFLEQLTEGADTCATKYHTSIIGGDLKETSEITLTGTAFGQVKKEEFMPRNGAQIGDILAVTGTLGKAGAGYYNLKHNIIDTNISQAFFEPRPRIKEGQTLASLQSVTSSMDISDGLSSSLYQLHDVNHLGFEIDKKQLPLASELLLLNQQQSTIHPTEIALHFGGDYELLITIPSAKFDHAKTQLEQIGGTLIPIGRVIEENNILLVENSDRKPLENKGYEHFKNHMP